MRTYSITKIKKEPRYCCGSLCRHLPVADATIWLSSLRLRSVKTSPSLKMTVNFSPLSSIRTILRPLYDLKNVPFTIMPSLEHYHASVDDTGTAEHAHGTCSSQLFTSVIYSYFFLAYTNKVTLKSRIVFIITS